MKRASKVMKALRHFMRDNSFKVEAGECKYKTHTHILTRLREWQTERYERGEEANVCAVHPATWEKVKRAITAMERLLVCDDKGNPTVDGTILVADSTVEPEKFFAR